MSKIIIEAWLSGETIQWRRKEYVTWDHQSARYKTIPAEEWKNHDPYKENQNIIMFFNTHDYRIKPKTIKVYGSMRFIPTTGTISCPWSMIQEITNNISFEIDPYNQITNIKGLN